MIGIDGDFAARFSLSTYVAWTGGEEAVVKLVNAEEGIRRHQT